MLLQQDDVLVQALRRNRFREYPGKRTVFLIPGKKLNSSLDNSKNVIIVFENSFKSTISVS